MESICFRAPARLRLLVLFLLSLCFLVTIAPAATPAGQARLLRYPSIHRDFVVFVHGGDLWRAPSPGGQAVRLTSHEGVELTPKISQDGAWVAFSAEYSGTRQVYVMPAAGGRPKQLTFYNDVGTMPPRGGFDYWVQGWHPDGKILVRMNRTPWGVRPGSYFLVDPEGGLEQPLPIPVGGGADYSSDGTKLAYVYYDREFRTWKRYEGGRNQDIWTFDFAAMKSTRITEAAGSDNFPMWRGDTIYFTSDREHTLNLYAHDLASGEVRKLTNFDDYDVLWPSLGPEAIVFMNGGWLYRHDLASGDTRKIPITMGDDGQIAVPRWETVSDNIASADLSPDGKRAVFEGRGDLFTVPAKNGPTRNLTRTQGVRESDPAWSPDGTWLAYYSDADGEMALYVREQDGSGEPRRIARGEQVWRAPAEWSPDGEKLAFGDSENRLTLVEVESGKLTLADQGTQGPIDNYHWSPDSRWLVYETNHPETTLPNLTVYSVDDGESRMLGDGTTSDRGAVFSTDGKYLFFLSDRDYNMAFSDFEFNYVYDNATRIYAVALDPEAEPLFPPRSDEVEIEEEGEGDGDGDGDGEDSGEVDEAEGEDDGESADEEETPPLIVVTDGFMQRTIALPGIEAGNYARLRAVEGAVFFLQFPDGEPPSLMRYDLEEREASSVLQDVSQYTLGARGEQVLYSAGDAWSIAPANPDAEGEELDLSGLRMKLDPRAEWAQMFEECWRIGRDWFYDPDMHDVGWEKMRKRYGALVPYVSHRSDLDFILGEMIGELESGHAYVQNGEMPSVDRVEGGMLGAELEADPSGRYRIAHIFPGENWDAAYRSPLTEPGVNVNEGEFLLAMDGEDLTTADNPYRLLEGKGDVQVTLLVNDKPEAEGARQVQVHTLTSEANLRYLDWVTSRAALVEELSGGRIGYIHLPDTAGRGNRALQKYFYSQVSKPGLIIDERNNGGGFIPDRMIEMLSRTVMSYWTGRGVRPNSTPGFRHDGPKAMLINGYAASGGDALPYYFRQAGLGKLIGTTTWGGLIGLSGNPMLVDGGGVLYPTFRFYDTDGEWAVEGIGVPPDIEVWDLPEAIAAGRDPSIEKAVEILLEELEGFQGDPETPTPPDMSGD
jgi:tricorn protease